MGCTSAKPPRNSQIKNTRKDIPSLYGTQVTIPGAAKVPTITDFNKEDEFQEAEQYLEAIRAIKQHKLIQLGDIKSLRLINTTNTY